MTRDSDLNPMRKHPLQEKRWYPGSIRHTSNDEWEVITNTHDRSRYGFTFWRSRHKLLAENVAWLLEENSCMIVNVLIRLTNKSFLHVEIITLLQSSMSVISIISEHLSFHLLWVLHIVVWFSMGFHFNHWKLPSYIFWEQDSVAHTNLLDIKSEKKWK